MDNKTEENKIDKETKQIKNALDNAGLLEKNMLEMTREELENVLHIMEDAIKNAEE